MSFYFQGGFEGKGVERADITLCIFPYQKEFIAVDLRDSQRVRPTVKLLNVDDVLGEEFYTAVEEAFSRLLRQSEHPFANLISLPVQVQEEVRNHSLKAILQKLDGGARDTSAPQIAILLFGGPVLQMDDEQVGELIREMLGPEASSSVVEECQAVVNRLLSKEKQILQSHERNQIKEMILGNSEEFFTLWEDPSRG